MTARGPVRMPAGAVAYSRVHTGVHYPTDVIIGSIVGAAIGDVTGAIVRSRMRRLASASVVRRSRRVRRLACCYG